MWKLWFSLLYVENLACKTFTDIQVDKNIILRLLSFVSDMKN